MLRHSKSGFAEVLGNPVTAFNDAHSKVALRAMGRALAQDRLCLAFQPIVKATNSDFPAFFECLLRIEEPSGHLASAGQFMAIIEGHELGRLVDRFVLRNALATLESHPHCRLSINISAQSLGDEEWLRVLHEAAESHTHVTDRLIVEITESSKLVGDDVSMSFFNHVREVGCSIAIDDFGTGYTSLANLRDFRFDMLKIDGSFVRGLIKHDVNRFLVEKMVEIAKKFDLLTIAEWVETAEEAQLLAEIGVDCLQGFHFGKPLESLPGGIGWESGDQISL